MTGRIIIGFLILTLGATAAAAQLSQFATATDDPIFPAGLEGERFQMLIDAINARNLTLAREFYAEHLVDELRERFTEESYLELYQWVAGTSGGVDFYGVRTYDPPRPGVTTVICKGRNYGAWWAIAFFYGDDPAAGLTDIRVTRARVPVDVAAATLSTEEFVGEVTGMMDRICEQGLFSGSVLVASGNDIVLQHTCGEADRSLHAFIDVDTKFNIGGMNAMFTAVAVAQLAERGLLSYADPMSKFLDESWLPAEIADRVTVHHLLTHTSGLGDFLGAAFQEGSATRFRVVDDYKELVSGETLRFDPGTDWFYSTTGLLLLGAVIESVTGGDYFDYIRENVYGPAGMKDTDSYDVDAPAENMAVGYSPSADGETGWEENGPGRFVRGGPAGGGFSTARDLHRFTVALASGNLVSGGTIQRMWTDQREGEGEYGYGFMLRKSGRGLVVGLGGEFAGAEAYYDVYVKTGYTVVVLTNLDGAAWPVDERIRELMQRLEQGSGGR